MHDAIPGIFLLEPPSVCLLELEGGEVRQFDDPGPVSWCGGATEPAEIANN